MYSETAAKQTVPPPSRSVGPAMVFSGFHALTARREIYTSGRHVQKKTIVIITITEIIIMMSQTIKRSVCTRTHSSAERSVKTISSAILPKT